MPGELQDDLIDCLAKQLGHAQLKARRDTLIRRAAMALPPAPDYRQAEILAGEARALSRGRLAMLTIPAAEEPATAKQCLFAASQILELPSSVRQYYRVLRRGGADI